MAFTYFSKLPIIDYPLSKTKSKRARDILHRLFVDQKFIDQSDYIKKYSVMDGDRPEIISDKLYGRSDLYSIILTLNDFDTTMLSGLPPHSAIYEEYLQEKYSEDVYYLIPTLSSIELNHGPISGDGRSGGYIFPIFGRGFQYGEKVFGAGSDGFQIYDTRAYVKEWDPVMSTLKLDVLAGSFVAGLTIANSNGETNFIIGHKKTGLEAVHHFETSISTTGGHPRTKGTLVDPLSRFYVVSNNGYYIPLGMTLSTNPGITATYANSIVYAYNKFDGLVAPTSNYIRVVTNREHEERKQEKKRSINVPEQQTGSLTVVIDTITELLESTTR
jgi:hypothetical protein